MVDTARDREAEASILDAFGRFILDQHGVLAQADASDRLRAITRTIVGSRTLLAHEQRADLRARRQALHTV